MHAHLHNLYNTGFVNKIDYGYLNCFPILRIFELFSFRFMTIKIPYSNISIFVLFFTSFLWIQLHSFDVRVQHASTIHILNAVVKDSMHCNQTLCAYHSEVHVQVYDLCRAWFVTFSLHINVLVVFFSAYLLSSNHFGVAIWQHRKKNPDYVRKASQRSVRICTDSNFFLFLYFAYRLSH